MDPQELLLVLRARWRVVLYSLAGTVALTLIVSLVLPAQYTATATVVVDVKSPDPIAGMTLPALVMPGYMSTQVEIISSDRVAQKVVKTLKLDSSPDVREQWLDETGGKGKLEVWLAELMQKKLDVRPSRDSNVISINYKSADPVFAAVIANTFAQAYIETTIELRVEPARQYALWFDKQSKSLRDNLEKTQNRLSEYHQAKGIVASDERLDVETAKLNELSTQLTVVQGQTSDAESKERSGKASDTMAEVTQNPLIATLKAEVARQEGRLQELAGNLGRNHPQYQRAESEVAVLRERLNVEIQKITTGFSTSRTVGRSKESELRAAIEAQRKKLLRLKRERDELAVLTRDVEAAQKAFEGVSQRFSMASLESQSSQTNIAVLTPATEPIKPSFPKLLLNFLAAVFLGTFLGIGAAFVLEILDRRIRSAENLAENLRLPLLGVIPGTGAASRSWRDFARLAFRRRTPPAIAAN